MAGRKSKKAIKKIESKKNTWRAGVYLRLSSDDGDNAESDSIKNQRELISLFLKKEEIEVIDYYIDDGYSGTSMLRPDFKRMMKDLVNEKINTIIVKDLSRFGRNYIEVGKYLELTFPLYGTRFIAVNDNIDSYKDPKSINNVIVPFKNLMNDEYARDISNKVRSVYRTKALNGEIVGGTTPYGYTKNPENKYQLIIDKDEEKNIKLIFKKYLDGDGVIKICKYLNDNKILCRKEIQRRKKKNISLEPDADSIKYKWSKSTIGKILTNETYIGNVVQNRTTSVSYKNHKVIYRPRNEWIVVKNTHEPIISKEDFNKVQQIFQERNSERKPATGLTIFYGKLKCADCGSGMCKMEDSRRGRFYSHYYCRNYKTTSSSCSPHKIKTSELNHLVLQSVLTQIKLVVDLEKAIQKLKDNGATRELEQKYRNNINKIENDIEKYKKMKKKDYEKWKLDIITQDEFCYNSNEYNEKIKNLEKELTSLNNLYNESIKELKKDNYWIEHFKRNKKIKTLSREMIYELIDCIYVHEGGNITIKFKYQDEFESAIEFIKLKEENNNE